MEFDGTEILIGKGAQADVVEAFWEDKKLHLPPGYAFPEHHDPEGTVPTL